MSTFQLILYYSVIVGFILSIARLIFWYFILIKSEVAMLYDHFRELPFGIAVAVSFLWPVQYFTILYSKKRIDKGIPIVPFGLKSNNTRISINLALINNQDYYFDESNFKKGIKSSSYLAKQFSLGLLSFPINGIFWTIGIVLLICRVGYRFYNS